MARDDGSAGFAKHTENNGEVPENKANNSGTLVRG